MRSVGGVLLGLITGLCVMVLVEMFSRHFEPGSALLVVLAGWFTGVIVATWLAARTGRGYVPGMIVGALFLIAGVVNMLTIPHPAWFWGAGVIVFVVATMIGTRLGAPIVAAQRPPMT